MNMGKSQTSLLRAAPRFFCPKNIGFDFQAQVWGSLPLPLPTQFFSKQIFWGKDFLD